MRRAIVVAPLVGVLLATSPCVGTAQQVVGADCYFRPGTERVEVQTSGTTRTVALTRARIACDGGVKLWADSLTFYESTGFTELLGNVVYEDTLRTLTATRASYYRDQRQLFANGNDSVDAVATTIADGVRLSGRNLTFYEAGGGRIEDEITVSGSRRDARPRALLPIGGEPRAEPGDSAARALAAADSVPPTPMTEPADTTPLDVVADRIFLRGQSYFEAIGRAEAVRDSLTMNADSLLWDDAATTLDLRGNADLLQGGTKIEGRRVRVRLPENEIREIETFGEGHLESGQLDLDAPWFRILFDRGEVDGLWAATLRRVDAVSEDPVGDAPTPLTEAEIPADEVLAETAEAEIDPQVAYRDSVDALQPVARSEGTTIRADSLDVDTTLGEPETMIAVGRAHAIAARDSVDASMLPEIAREDWIRGDTIVATFARVAIARSDSTSLEIERVTSSGSASSLYRMPPTRDSVAAAPEAVASADAAVSSDTAAVVVPDSTAIPAPPAGDPEAAPSDSLSVRPSAVILPESAPGVHYVVARRIILDFANGEVRRMEVLGLTEGYHFEPRRSGAGSDTRAATERTR